MGAFDVDLRKLIEEWLKRGNHPASMVRDMQTEIERLSAKKD